MIVNIILGVPFGNIWGSRSDYGNVQLNSRLCRRRKARTVFSDQQLTGLEKRFEVQRYLSTPERVELASELRLSETQVSSHFTYMNVHTSTHLVNI